MDCPALQYMSGKNTKVYHNYLNMRAKDIENDSVGSKVVIHIKPNVCQSFVCPDNLLYVHPHTHYSLRPKGTSDHVAALHFNEENKFPLWGWGMESLLDAKVTPSCKSMAPVNHVKPVKRQIFWILPHLPHAFLTWHRSFAEVTKEQKQALCIPLQQAFE